MSIYSVIDICVHLESFRNIDLYQQGVYRLRVKVYSEDSLGSVYDISLKLSPRSSDLHCLDPARLGAQSAESRAFLVRYCNEEVQLKESVYFQIKVKDWTGVKLQYDLLFNDLDGKVKPDDLAEMNIKELEMRVLSSFEVSLEYPSCFIAKYLPVVFPVHISLVNCMVHYLVVDYFVKTSNFEPVSLFKDRSGSAREYVGSSETDKIYNLYMEVLVNNHKTLTEYYMHAIGRCITAEMRVSLDHRCLPAGLKLPGDHYNLNSFSQRVACHDPETVSEELIKELHNVGRQLSQLWKKMMEIINKNPRSISNLLKETYHSETRNIFCRNVIKKAARANDFSVSLQKSDKVNHSLAELRRKENSKNRGCFGYEPIMIDEVFLSEHLSGSYNIHSTLLRQRKKFSELHLIVLVHGYKGSSKDMNVFRNEISVLFPHAVFLVSVANEDCTEASISKLGINLAQEVKEFFCVNGSAQIGNVSFIGHSLGGLIIRAALPLLLEYSGKFHCLITISTPHLGVLEGSKLVQAGIWILNYVKKTDSLCELRMADSKFPESSLLYRLSNFTGFELFTHLVLVSSPQDSYSPHYSSRIEVPKSSSDPPNVFSKMAKNLLSKRHKLNRIDLDFRIKDTNLDSIIGRTGHVEFLENKLFMRYLLYLHPEFFQ